MHNQRLFIRAWALLALVLVAVTVLLYALHITPGKTRTEILREAFEQASQLCYAHFDGRELQGCLVGAMQAHLQALGGHNEPPATLGVALPPRQDI